MPAGISVTDFAAAEGSPLPCLSQWCLTSGNDLNFTDGVKVGGLDKTARHSATKRGPAPIAANSHRVCVTRARSMPFITPPSSRVAP
jgi:hypothetical protein